MSKASSTHQKLLEALTYLDCYEDTRMSKVWRVFRHDMDPGRWLFLGCGGALRVGNNTQDFKAAYVDKIRLLKVWDDIPKGIILQKVSNL